jgi:hypothetical protein
MGNVFSTSRRRPESIDMDAGANREALGDLVDTSPYLQPGSDIVALMILEHQTQMHNYLTLANFETRRAEHYDTIMAKALERPAGHRSESCKRRIAGVAEKLVRYMLFADEFELTASVKGMSQFAKEFQTLGPQDRKGRSLRELELKTRMFKYPCSYLIYSESFEQLPPSVKQVAYQRLDEVLAGRDSSGDFDYLTAAMRKDIREILRDTKPGIAQGLSH